MSAARGLAGSAGFTALGAAAREKLTASVAFARLRAARHELAAGVVLTAVSNVPFELSFKCTRCAEVFWFENLSWREGGFTAWRLITGYVDCAGPATARRGTDHGLRVHP